MPRIQAETTYHIALTEEEVEGIADGDAVAVDLPDGNTIKLTGGDEAAVNSAVTPSGDAGLEDVRELVEAAQEDQPEPKGSDPEPADGNPHAGGIIDIERTDDPDESED